MAPSSLIAHKISHITREGTSTMVEEEEVIAASVLEEEILVEEKKGDTCSSNIPADVYELEILSYLPAKNLQTLKIVCKDWLQLIISSSYFVRLHLSRGIQSRIRVLMVNFLFRGIIEYNNYYRETRQVISYPQQFVWGWRLLGSADGLAYFDNGSLGYLFNPSTRKCFVVQLSPAPPEDNCPYYYWFGNLSGGGYVLVIGMAFREPRYETWVYKFTRNSNIVNRICSTQLIISKSLYPIEDRGTFAQGVVHWPVRLNFMSPCYTILAYHLSKNKHMEISPPCQCEFRLGLFVDGCSLFATSKNDMLSVVEVWIMKSNCWTKYANIGGSNNFRILSPVGFFPNGDLIMHVDNSLLMKYSFSYKEATLLMDCRMDMEEVVVC